MALPFGERENNRFVLYRLVALRFNYRGAFLIKEIGIVGEAILSVPFIIGVTYSKIYDKNKKRG